MKLFKNFKTKKQLRKEIENLKVQLAKQQENNLKLLQQCSNLQTKERQLERFRVNVEDTIPSELPYKKDEFFKMRIREKVLDEVKDYLRANDYVSFEITPMRGEYTALLRAGLDIVIAKTPES